MPFPLPDIPNTITDPAVKPFLEKYYEISNEADLHEDYTDLFIKDGEFSMNDKKAKGAKDILGLRKALWAHVPGRDHRPLQIYTHGDDQYNLFILGDVTYEHHHGHQTGSDWAAKVELVKEGQDLKVKQYSIIVDSKAHH